MNIFLMTGNAVHLMAFFILIFDIIKNKNCTGISGKTQLLLATVFTCRYTDLMTVYISFYNTSFKIMFIGLTFCILYLIYCKYRETYDHKNDTFWEILLVIPVAVLSIGINYYTVGSNWPQHSYQMVQEVLWTFSEYLEAVAIIPQYYMVRKTKNGKRILPYVLTLFTYRTLYIFNWIYRTIEENDRDYISYVSGSIETIILFILIIDIQQLKEDVVPKWQEISEIFTIEAAKIGQMKKIPSDDKQQLLGEKVNHSDT